MRGTTGSFKPGASGSWDEAKPWKNVGMDALGNVPSSAVKYASGLAGAVMNPIDTAGGVLKLGQGAVVNAMPDAAIDLINRINPSLAGKRAEVSNIASQVGRQYAQDYGSTEGFKQKLSTDPVGVAADASMLFSGGAMLAPKASTLNTVLNKAATYTNPINAVVKPAAIAGNLSANAVGAFGTHTGGMPIKEAFKAGMKGGEASKAFRENMRNKVPMTDVLDTAKANVAEMGRLKSAEYRAGMANVSGDKTVLGFNGIDDAVSKAHGQVTFKGQVKNTKAAQVVQQINKEISDWKRLNPKEFHTPEGLDALKQKIGGIVEGIPFEEKTARMVGQNVYNSVKSEIVKQAPTYAKTMKSYADAMDEIKEIERALSLGNKASVDTAMRKLQSLTRNNVNTNYGNRLDLARTLEQKGGNQLMPALAGQALNTWVPRGIGGTVAGGVGLGGYAVGGLPGAAGMLAIQSPRLVGETAYKLGQGSRVFNRIGEAGLQPAALANIMAQGGLLQGR
jgi:hypothetical protein